MGELEQNQKQEPAKIVVVVVFGLNWAISVLDSKVIGLC